MSKIKLIRAYSRALFASTWALVYIVNLSFEAIDASVFDAKSVA